MTPGRCPGPALPPEEHGAAPVALTGQPQAVGGNEAEATLAAIRATGAPIAEALGLAAQAHGPAPLLAALVAALHDGAQGDRWLSPADAMDILTEVAAHAPALAQLGLLAWGAERKVADSLTLEGQAWVETLPEGMELAGSLYAAGSGILTLPRRLGIRKDLWLCGCLAWDGRIQEGVRVGKEVITDRYLGGITLDGWRGCHPDGESEGIPKVLG
jgi:hypothetical protein